MKHKKTGRFYALKMLSKALVLKTKQLEHILCEREVLEALSFPFIVNVYATFQDEDYLYLVLEYSIGGEFFTHLRKANRFSNDTVRPLPCHALHCSALPCSALPLVALSLPRPSLTPPSFPCPAPPRPALHSNASFLPPPPPHPETWLPQHWQLR